MPFHNVTHIEKRNINGKFTSKIAPSLSAGYELCIKAVCADLERRSNSSVMTSALTKGASHSQIQSALAVLQNVQDCVVSR